MDTIIYTVKTHYIHHPLEKAKVVDLVSGPFSEIQKFNEKEHLNYIQLLAIDYCHLP